MREEPLAFRVLRTRIYEISTRALQPPKSSSCSIIKLANDQSNHRMHVLVIEIFEQAASLLLDLKRNSRLVRKREGTRALPATCSKLSAPA
jgi:hypothetical protein